MNNFTTLIEDKMKFKRDLDNFIYDTRELVTTLNQILVQIDGDRQGDRYLLTEDQRLAMLDGVGRFKL